MPICEQSFYWDNKFYSQTAERSDEAKARAERAKVEAERAQAEAERARKAQEEWYKAHPEEKRKREQAMIKSLNSSMVLVEGGTFTMGCNSEQAREQGYSCYESNVPAHQVTLGSYYISKYEITQKQWQEVMRTNPSQFKGDDLPVESVSWDDVQKFIRELNKITSKQYRLPTEAEWEYAARGGAKSNDYTYSGSNTVDEVAWYKRNSEGKTHPVGTKRANELDIYDMSGNVMEWCNDYRASEYSNDSQTNPQGSSTGSSRVVRGGGWGDTGYSYDFETVCFRWNGWPDERKGNLGFRLACSAE